MKRHVVGVAFLAVLALLVWGFVQDYRQALPWQHTVAVTLTTPAAGLSLDPPADVKLRGIVVGEVRSVSANGTDATLHLAIDPGQRSLIPADVDAAIIPKTLFGQKYVDLIIPKNASSARIAAGDVIRQSTTSVELQTVFTDLLPVLDTLQPALVSRTLTAMATALDGKGAQLGRTITTLDTYLKGIVPHTDTLVHDLAQLATTSDVYADHARQILTTLDNARAISDQLLVPKRSGITTLLSQVTTAADTARGTLVEDGSALVTLAGDALPVLKVLSTYAKSLPCLVHGFVIGNNLTDHALGGAGPYLRVSFDVLSTQHRNYSYPADSPSTPTSDANLNHLDQNVTSWAPYCTQIQSRNENLPDVAPLSYNYTPPTTTSSASSSAASSSSAAAASDGIGAAGSAGQVTVVRGIASKRSSAPLATLLLGPVLQNGMTLP